MSNDTYEPTSKVLRTVQLDIELDRDLRALSFWEGRTKGEIMRDAIAAYVAAEFGAVGRAGYIARRMGGAPATEGGQP